MGHSGSGGNGSPIVARRTASREPTMGQRWSAEFWLATWTFPLRESLPPTFLAVVSGTLAYLPVPNLILLSLRSHDLLSLRFVTSLSSARSFQGSAPAEGIPLRRWPRLPPRVRRIRRSSQEWP